MDSLLNVPISWFQNSHGCANAAKQEGICDRGNQNGNSQWSSPVVVNIANSIKMYHPVSRFQSPGWDPSRWATRGLKCHDFSQSPWVWLGEEPSDIQRSRERGRSERAEWPKREHVSLKYFQFIITKRCYHIKTNLLFSSLLPPPSYPGGGGSREHHTC